MDDKTQAGRPVRMLRYCVQGHEIVYTVGEIVRSVCPYCKSPVDRRRPPVPYDTVHDGEKPVESAVRSEEKAQRGEEAVPELFGGPRRSGLRRGASCAFGDVQRTPAGSCAFGQKAQGQAGAQADSTFGRALGRQEPGFGTTADRVSAASVGSGLFLNYFGDRLEIPVDGAWIGREGLGSEWFDGNLMVSRKHVYVHPIPRSARLQVNEDRSLNGAFWIGKDGRRTRLTGAQMLEPGDVLWIYNIPLRLEEGGR